ncbi:hypothetical protein BH09MYX1_BH09MYX1_29830 [soil metagenome]
MTVTHTQAAATAATAATPPILPIVPSGPYPVLFATTDAAAQTKARAAFIKANPGWQVTFHPSGRFITSHPATPVAALGTESGARAFLDASAPTWGVDAAVFDHPVAHGDQITFGVSRWGPYALGGLTVSPTSVSGVFLGPLGVPPRQLYDETLTRLIVGRRFDFLVTTETVFHPCDPGPHGGCPGAPEPPHTRRESILIDRKNVLKIERSVRGVTRPNDPTRWELRVVAGFALDVAHGQCTEPYTSPSDPRTQCSYRLDVDGKPASGMVLDAVTGEPLFDRSLVLQVAVLSAD